MKKAPDYSHVLREVKNILDEYGIVRPPINPVEIARDKGFEIKFVTFSGEYESVSGFYDPSECAIYVNKNESPLRQTFTIAHELAHAILHKDWAESDGYKVLWRDPSRNTTDDPYEKEANVFAANLLVPRDMLSQYYDELSLPDLSKLFVVSVPVIRNRLAREYGI